jgi:hypothetical protein
MKTAFRFDLAGSTVHACVSCAMSISKHVTEATSRLRPSAIVIQPHHQICFRPLVMCAGFLLAAGPPTMPMSNILLPGELPLGFWVPLVRMQFRMYGPQMTEGVTLRLVEALQQGVDAYYKVFRLRTQVQQQTLRGCEVPCLVTQHAHCHAVCNN